MKKLILALLISATVSLNAGGLSREHKDMAGRLINTVSAIEGTYYRCNKVDNAIRSNWDGSIEVYCDNYSSKFHIKKIGGRWVVKALR